MNIPPLQFSERATAAVTVFAAFTVAQQGIQILHYSTLAIKGQLYGVHGQLIVIYDQMLRTDEVNVDVQLAALVASAIPLVSQLVTLTAQLPTTNNNATRVARMRIVANNALTTLESINP
jgi:hypothetical protein